jgi:hypothetical protein
MLTSKKEINGQANTKKSIFSRTTSVSIHISARQSVTWKILTNIDDFARWNSTILYLKGNLNIGSKLKVKSNLDLEKKINLLCFQPYSSSKNDVDKRKCTSF